MANRNSIRHDLQRLQDLANVMGASTQPYEPFGSTMQVGDDEHMWLGDPCTCAWWSDYVLALVKFASHSW
jgi:hypothetical protein